MGNAAKKADVGYRCPVRGCPKHNNRLFTPMGLAQHMIVMHKEEFEKRLRAKVVTKG